MNTPPRDHLESVRIPTAAEIGAAKEALERCILLDWDFRRLEEDDSVFIGPGSIIYCDPPYDGDGSFRQYIAEGFSQRDQHDLIVLLAAWCDRGAFCVTTNANTDFITREIAEFWPAATVVRVEASRSISAHGDRNSAKEIIAYA
jgi:site-specific DNA-adenine methylase